MSDDENNAEALSLEHRILIKLRLVLAAVVRDVTPPPGMRNPLSDQTIEDIRTAFSLIAARERELRGEETKPDLPVFRDSGATARIVEFDTAATESTGKDENKK